MGKLSDNEEMRNKILKLESLTEVWHAKNKEKIASSVIFLRSLNSPMNTTADKYITDMITSAETILDGLTLEGKKDD